MSIEDAPGRRRRRRAAAAFAAAGILIPVGYAATAASCRGPFVYGCIGPALEFLFASLAMAGLVEAAFVRGWGGAGALLAGVLVVCLGLEVVVSVTGLTTSEGMVGSVAISFICAIPLLVGYGIGRGLARLASFG